jgi:hypothetical protein
LYIGHNPLISANHCENRDAPESYLGGIELCNRLVFGAMNAELVPQPIETIVNTNQTDSIYSKGSKRLAVGKSSDNYRHIEEDKRHMNDEFGELWLHQFLKKFA